MAVLKYLLPYAICTVTFMYFQSDFVFAAKNCICCTNEKEVNDTPLYCGADKLDPKANVSHCPMTEEKTCGGFSYIENKTFRVVRSNNINCTELDLHKENITKFVCKSCNDDNCNSFDLNFPKSSSNQIGYSVIPLLLSIVLAMYPN